MSLIAKANQRTVLNNKKNVELDTYVIISTQNQIVNYLPYLIYKNKINKIYNITISNSEKNKKWDSNLKNVLKEQTIKDKEQTIKDIEFGYGEYHNIDTVISKLKSNIPANAKILWNVTGGQKAFLLAVNKLANQRKNDFIGYVDGNTSKFLVYGIGLQENECNLQENECNILNSNIISFEQLLNLNGFRFNKKNPSLLNEQELTDYSNIFEKYLTHKESRTQIIELGELAKKKQAGLLNDLGNNLKKSLKCENNAEIKIMEYSGALYKCQENVERVWNDFKSERDKIIEQLKNSINSINNNLINDDFDFGKFFEKMVYAALKNKFSNQCHSIHLGVKINFYEDDSNANHIDELDCVIVKKNGQVLNLELKTGSISGDVAKGHNYTTLSTSGMYGSPILLIPTTERELDGNNLSGLLKKFKEAKDNAKNSQVEFWFIDKLYEKIEHLLKS